MKALLYCWDPSALTHGRAMTEAVVKAFLQDLDKELDGKAADALLVCGVEQTTDAGLPVPATVKKRWQRWNLKGHPDKGGDNGSFLAMQQRYTDFKKTFQEWLEEDTTGQQLGFKEWCRQKDERSAGINQTALRAEAKEKAEQALSTAEKALAEGRYVDAKQAGERAVRHYEEYQRMIRVGRGEIRDLIARASGVLGQAEEAQKQQEAELQERREQEEAVGVLDSMWMTMCASIGLAQGGYAATPKQKLDDIQKSFGDMQASHRQQLTKERQANEQNEAMWRSKVQEMQTVHRQELARERQTNEQNEERWKSKVQELQANEQQVELRHQVALEHAKKERDKASAERDEQTRRNRELEADVDQFRGAFAEKDSTGRPWWDFLGMCKTKLDKATPKQITQMIEASKKSCKRARKELDEKEASLERAIGDLKVEQEHSSALQNTLDTVNAEKERLRSVVQEQHALIEAQVLRESALTSEKGAMEEQVRSLKASLEEQNAARLEMSSAILGRICPMLAEGMSVADEVKGYFDDLQAEDNEKKFKVQYKDEIRVISCPDSRDLFKELTWRARERFALPDDGLAFFKYQDSENDVISVCSTVELKEAICQFPSCYPKLQLCVQQTAPNSGIRQAGTDVSEAAVMGGAAQ